MLTSTTIFLTFLILLIPLLTLRLLYILPQYRHPPTRRARSTTRLLIVLGSGGHTTEMLAMLSRVQVEEYAQRVWVVSSGDEFSARKAGEFEEGRVGREKHGEGGKLGNGSYSIKTIPRARRVHQSLLTAPVSSLRTLFACFPLLLHPAPPDLILTNGPATATIVVLASLLLRFFNVGGCSSQGKMRTIYVESWARVRRLSLSGRMLCGVVDRFLVQWEGLEGAKGWAGGRAEYRGVLV